MERFGMAGNLLVSEEIRVGNFVAQRIDDPMSWAEGSIVPQEGMEAPKAQHELARTVLDSIEKVSKSQEGLSACTDGRIPLRLESGEPVPVRPQLVGGNLVSAFYIAESLGPRFYKDPNASLEQRINEVAEFLADNDKKPSGHINCGAAAGFGAVSANVPRFAKHESGLFIARAQFFLPEGVYDQALHDEMMAGNEQRAKNNVYAQLHPDMFLNAIRRVSGAAAIAELLDDGRGVHGHVEDEIFRLQTPGYAINEGAVAEATGGREVFGVNDDEMDKLAHLFGRGEDDDYRISRMGVEDFANSGHGTLSRNLPTYRVTLALAA